MRFGSRRRSRGQALTEVAMVAPIFFLMVFGAIDIGRVVWANDALANAAREGARYASVHAGFDPSLTEPVTKADIRAYTVGYAIAAGISPTVTVCFSDPNNIANQQTGCTGDVDQSPEVGYARGNLVTVTVTSQVPIIVGSFFGAGNWTIFGESTVLVNN